MSSVRSEYGPTLGELGRPYWERLGRGAKLAAVAVAAIVVIAIVAEGIKHAGNGLTRVVVTKPFAFNAGYKPGLRKDKPVGGDLLLLSSSRSDRQSFAVRPVQLPPYRGDASVGLMAASDRMVDVMSREYPRFSYRGEGRARIADLPGYQILFTTVLGGKTVYGRRLLLVPDDQPGVRAGAQITLLAQRSPAVQKVGDVGNNGLLKAPLRSFRFGTAGP